MLSAYAPADAIQTTFVPSGAVQKAGGYMPIRAEMTASEAGIKKKPADVTAPHYGTLTFGDKKIAFVLDEPAGGTPRLFVDANHDGDLTNDPAVTWTGTKRGDYTMYMGSTKVDIGKSEPVGITMYRFDPKDPARAALKETMLYYGDFGYEVKLTLDGKTSTSFIAGEPTPRTTLSVDRNGDGKISYTREIITVGKPFNFTGTTYVLNLDNGKFKLDKAKESLPMASLPPDLAVGKPVLKFTATTTDGQKLNFPEDFKGKVVMLDFWATWCGPCKAELPNVKAAYAKWHDQGFEIVGISFDQENYADKLAEFTKQNDMPWRQVYEGKYWNTTIGTLFDVSAIPATILVDGTTGKIIAREDSLRGPKIVETIEKALAARTRTSN